MKQFLVLLALGVIAVFSFNTMVMMEEGTIESDPVQALLIEEGTADPEHAPLIETEHESLITVGSKAPDFTLPNANGEMRTLSELLKAGPIVLSFYRGGWCPYCNEQLYAFQKILPELKEHSAALVAISPEKPERAQDTVLKNELEFEVLSDEGNRITRLYDLLWVLPEEKREGFSGWLKKETGKTLSEFNGVEGYELPIPATFVIAQDGTISYVFKDEDYKKRAKMEDILTALKNLEERAPE